VKRGPCYAASFEGDNDTAIAVPAWDDRCVVSRRKKRARASDPLAAYRKIRKPMPPPEKVMRDRRRELEDEQARREIDAAGDPPAGERGR
jgi:hypothetical protein